MTAEIPWDLRDDEVELRGGWTVGGANVRADAVCERIEWLLASRLERLATDASGWETLYRDPRDGRLWEHTYR